MWSYPLTAIALTVAGLIVAGAIVWWQTIQSANDAYRSALARTVASAYASHLNAQLVTLRRQMEAMASAPSTLAALTSFDEAVIAAEEQHLAAVMPWAERVDLIRVGQARLDLNAATPISFAALDVIRRARSEPFVGPEASSINQRVVFYVARPITDAGTVAGVLFAAVSMDYLLEPLARFDASLGTVTIEQKFASAPATQVLTYGAAPGSGEAVRAELTAPIWTLSFRPSRSLTTPLGGAAELVTPFLVALAMALAGIGLAFGRLFRAFEHDGATLLDYVSRLVRGQGGNIDRYRLKLFRQIAVAGSRVARPPAPENPRQTKEPQSEASPERRPARAGKRKPPAASDEDAAAPKADKDDFLDVARRAVDDNFGIEVSEEVSPVDAGLKLDPEIFRAYDIRGIVGKNFDEDVVYWIGRAFAGEARSESMNRAAVAGDGRKSSDALRRALTRGLIEGGMDVIDIGMVPTPLLYYATHALDTGTGIMVTGSHNPPDYNGLKMMIGGVTLAEERIQRLRQRIIDNELPEGTGAVDETDIVDHYIERITDDVVVAQPLKVVVDAGNGVAGAVAPKLLTALGCEVVPLYCDVDGDFPNHHPDPADPKNLNDLITVVKAEHADLGLAFDGDGDRLGLVTNTGEIIWPDKLMMLFCRDIVGRNPGADIVYDVKCSRHLNSIISEHGGRPIMWKTGHSHIKAKLKETGALLGGEFSGHICFAERWYGFDDALYSAARLLEIVGAESLPVNKLFDEFPVTFSTPEIKVESTDARKFEVLEKLRKEGEFGEGTITAIDGIRVDYADGWGLIRASNTSPMLTLRFEADGQSALDRIQRLFDGELKKIDPALGFYA